MEPTSDNASQYLEDYPSLVDEPIYVLKDLDQSEIDGKRVDALLCQAGVNEMDRSTGRKLVREEFRVRKAEGHVSGVERAPRAFRQKHRTLLLRVEGQRARAHTERTRHERQVERRRRIRQAYIRRPPRVIERDFRTGQVDQTGGVPVGCRRIIGNRRKGGAHAGGPGRYRDFQELERIRSHLGERFRCQQNSPRR